jgi:predicted transcriptional regulator of viral defense system
MSRSTIQNKHKLFEIAASQYGLFTAKQAIEAGFKKNNHPYHVRAGNWVREWHGIYRLVRFPPHPDSELALWTLWSYDRSGKPQAIYSHETALQIFDISDLMPAKLHITVPNNFRKQPPKCLVMHRGQIPEQDIEFRDEFWVTKPLRTLFDLITTDSVSRDILRQALRESLQRGLIMQYQIQQIKDNSRIDSTTPQIQKLLFLLKEINI